MPWYSETWTWIDGDWHEGNPPIIGPRSHASWLGSTVFDGARAFEGVMPDLDRHAERVNRSAETLGLKPTMAAEAIVELTQGGRETVRGPGDLREAHVLGGGRRADHHHPGPGLDPLRALPVRGADADPRRPAPHPRELPPPDPRIDADRRQGGLPLPEQRPRLREAQAKGFDNALVCDALGNVAETGTSNVFMARDGAVMTPAANGTFLNGITRQRVIRLLRDEGVPVIEGTLRPDDFAAADEIFITGNYSKLMPVLKLDDREFQPGPLYRKARELYWAFAHDGAA